MNDNLTFGATLLASLVGLVATVWVEATSPTERAGSATAVVQHDNAPRVARDHDKDCATFAAAPMADR